MKTWNLVIALCTTFLSMHAWAFDPAMYAVDTRVEVNASPPQIRMSWPAVDYARQYIIRRKALTDANWTTTLATLPANSTGYTDSSVQVGSAFEYEVQMDTSLYPWPQGDSSQWISAYSYLYAGVNAPLEDFKGKVILVVDSSVAPALVNELNQFQQDLVGAGWLPIRRDVVRNGSPWQVREMIRAEYNADPSNVRAVVLIGHVPVPYSGDIAPDLHQSHMGAWPADLFYGEMNGNWTDSTVSITSEDSSANNNYPGDGKFDQSQIPSTVELEVGRVDFWGMNAFQPRTEIDLLRNYFRKDHQFRFRQFTLPRRAVLHDNFGDLAGDAPAVDAWRHFGSFFGPGNVQEIGPDQFFNTLNNGGYLWAYGCGGGGDTKADGIGSTFDFANNNPQSAFLILHGSYFGDWNTTDNFLRAAIATPGYTLASIWSGLPHWFMHHMALGKEVGYSTRISQNNVNIYKSHINLSANQVHIGLMGDPTLPMFPVAPPTNLSGNSTGNGIGLSWSASGDENIVGYNIYYSQYPGGPYTRINGSPVNATGFTHSVGPGTYYYMVRAIKLERSGSGTFYNASQGVFATVTKVDGGGGGLPTVSIVAENPSAIEGSTQGRFRISRDSAGSSELVIYYSISGTALNGADYVNIPQSITIPAGGLSAGIVITAYADAQVEGDETVTLSINDSSLYSRGNSSATVTIHDSSTGNQRPTISPITDQSAFVAKPVGPVSFTIGDAETAAENLQVRATSSDESIIPEADIALGGSGSSRSIEVTPISTGKVNITIMVSDGELEATRNFYVTVSPANKVPTANALNLSLLEGSSTNIVLSGTDPEGATLSYLIVANPVHGTLSGAAPNITYTPAPGFSGTDSFTYKVNDGVDDSGPATVTLTVIAVNHPPNANAQSLQLAEDSPLPIKLTATDADSDPITYLIISGPTNGTLTGIAPNLTYLPFTNYNGADSFTFKASDGKLDSAPALVTLSIAPLNDAPVLVPPASQALHKNSAAMTWQFSVSDVDDSVGAIKVTASSSDSSIVAPSGILLSGTGTTRSVTITPMLGATGQVQIYLMASDAKASSSNSFVLLITNTPPLAMDDSLTTAANESMQISEATLLSNDTDADGDLLKLVGADLSSEHGGTLLLAGGSITYTPAPGYTGLDSFSYQIADSSDSRATGHVNIEVKALARLLSITAQRNGSVQIKFSGPASRTAIILSSDDSLTWRIAGSVQTNSSGDAQWTDTRAASSRFKLYRIEWP
jgi:hypothetical protein